MSCSIPVLSHLQFTYYFVIFIRLILSISNFYYSTHLLVGSYQFLTLFSTFSCLFSTSMDKLNILYLKHSSSVSNMTVCSPYQLLHFYPFHINLSLYNFSTMILKQKQYFSSLQNVDSLQNLSIKRF